MHTVFMAKNTNKSKSSAWVGSSLCASHAASHNLSANEFTLVPHHSEQADDEEVACDCCTVAIMRKAGAL